MAIEQTEEKAVRILTVDEILQAPDIAESLVAVPQWGGSVRIRSLTREQVVTIRKQATRRIVVPNQGVQEQPDTATTEILMFLAGVVEPKFGREHILALQGKSAAAFQRVLKAILDLSGITELAQTSGEAEQAAEAEFQG